MANKGAWCALLIICIVVAGTFGKAKADSLMEQYKNCFQTCHDDCHGEGNGNTFCEMKCDTECMAKETAAKLNMHP